MRAFLLLLISGAGLSAQVVFTRMADRIAVAIDGKPYTEYFLAADGNKPYLYPLRTLAGVNVTRHFPMEQVAGETKDHPHHRGMFFAHGDVSGVNFWSTEPGTNAPNKGSMRLAKIVAAEGGATSGTIIAAFDALDPQGKAMMTETRTLTFHAGPGPRTIDFKIDVKALRDLKFGDTKEGTFGVRVATAMTQDNGGHMMNAEGEEGQDHVWGKRSPWVDYWGTVDGARVGIAVMDNPANPRYPTYWHIRAYGLLAANPFGVHDFTGDKTKDGSMTVEAGHTVTFRYRVVIHSGDARSARIASLYQQYSAGR